MKLIAIIITITLIGCSKSKFFEPTSECQPCCLLSDKYSADSVYKRTDTLWFERYVCNADLDSIRAQPSSIIKLCADNSIENWRYVVGNVITHPIKLKP